MRLWIVFLIGSVLLSATEQTYYRIVIGSYSKSENAEADKERFATIMQRDEGFVRLQQIQGIDFEIYNGSKYHTLSIKPFVSKTDAQDVLTLVHTIDKAPFIGRYTQNTNTPSAATHAVSISSHSSSESSESSESSAASSEPAKVAEPSLVIEATQPSSVYAASSSVPHSVAVIGDTQASSQKASFGVWNWVVWLLTLLPGIGALWLWRSNRGLRRRVQQLESQLAHQNSDAISKEAFLSRMSHEIRTPMNAIIGFSHVLLESRLDTTQTQYVQNVQNAAALLLSIVNDLLDYSKIEAGQVGLEKRQFNINAMLDNVSARFTQKAADKRLEFIFEIHNNVPSRIVGDEAKLEAVLNNLLGNAIKFTYKGEVLLKIKRLSASEKQILLEFRVCDTGIGIRSEQLEMLFDSFKQADSSKSRSFDGMGLGLSICKEYVGMMGGAIEVQSAPDKGSCFIFTVLFDAPEQIELRNYRLPDRSIMNKRVLVVDNNTIAAGALQRMIAYYHYHADIVASEDEALRVLKNREYDIVCLDSKLLESENADTIQRFKEYTNAKIVLLENNVVRALSGAVAGVDAELKKPFSQQDLFNTIINLYSERPTAQEQIPQHGIKERLKAFEGRKILLAEDNAINQNVILSLLKESGIKLMIANNGQEAVELLAEHPDVGMVFMDISMPVMNGYEAARAIRAQQRFASIPIVALTANIQPSDVRQSFEAGMQEHIGKPFNVSAFYEAIVKYMGDGIHLAPLLESEVPVRDVDLYLNKERGLELVGGDTALFEELLGEFVGMFGGAPQSIATLIVEGSFEAAVKLVHDIKGVSANLGAMKLHEVAKALEATLKRADARLAEEELAHYSEVHHATIAAMSA